MTFVVEVDDATIVRAAPIARKFVGQPVENIRRWVRRQGGYREAWLVPSLATDDLAKGGTVDTQHRSEKEDQWHAAQ